MSFRSHAIVSLSGVNVKQKIAESSQGLRCRRSANSNNPGVVDQMSRLSVQGCRSYHPSDKLAKKSEIRQTEVDVGKKIAESNAG